MEYYQLDIHDFHLCLVRKISLNTWFLLNYRKYVCFVLKRQLTIYSKISVLSANESL